MTITSGATAERLRAPDRRPRAVLVDVFETMLQVDALRFRFVDVGRPEHEWELFFARTLRDGMAHTLAGAVRPFAEVAREALRTTTGRTLSDEAVEHVLAGFRELPPHPDVEPALMALARARIPAYGFTHGTESVACDALDKAGLRTYLRDVFSTERIRSFKPPARVYHWACQRWSWRRRRWRSWQHTPGTCTAPCVPGSSAASPPGWRAPCRTWWSAPTWPPSGWTRWWTGSSPCRSDAACPAPAWPAPG